MAQETVTIPKEEYQKLKRQAQIDMDILQQAAKQAGLTRADVKKAIKDVRNAA